MFTRRAIGYPGNEVLKCWIQEFYPDSRPLVIRSDTNKCFSPEERSQAVRELCSRRGTARKVAQKIGVSVPVLYKWKKDLISDETYKSLRKRNAAPQDQGALLGEIQRLKQQVYLLQLERDILTKANELLNKWQRSTWESPITSVDDYYHVTANIALLVWVTNVEENPAIINFSTGYPVCTQYYP